MTRLAWADAATRRSEQGVDHGVLYPLSGPGVVWNGLTAVNETPERDQAEARYFEGIKRGEDVAPGVFRATLEAFSAPRELAPALGHKAVQKGFLLTSQPKEKFGLSWRTMINVEEYKIHIAYNLTATPSTRSYATKTAMPNPSMLNLTLDAVPVPTTAFKPSAHFIVDSTKTPVGKLYAVQDILYGTDTEEPRLPTLAELIALFA